MKEIPSKLKELPVLITALLPKKDKADKTQDEAESPADKAPDATNTVITCDNCNTSFTLPDGHIPPEGRKVRCSSCKHVWHQAFLGTIEDSKPDTSDKKAKKSKKKALIDKHMPGAPKRPRFITPINRLQVLLVLLLTPICSVLSILSNHEYLRNFDPFYESIGIISTDNLAFTKFEVKKTLDGRDIRYVVSGTITNESNRDLFVPPLRLVALSKGGRTISTETIKPPLVFIAGGSSMTYNKDIVISGSSYKVTLDIGNKWELFFR